MDRIGLGISSSSTFSLWLEELPVPAMVLVMAKSSGGGASRQHCTNPRSVGDVGGVYGLAMNLVVRIVAPTSLYSAGDRGPSTIVG